VKPFYVYVDEISVKLRVETDEQSEDSEIGCEGRTSDTESKGETEIEIRPRMGLGYMVS
jgi:hypothetical protein